MATTAGKISTLSNWRIKCFSDFSEYLICFSMGPILFTAVVAIFKLLIDFSQLWWQSLKY
jgi:hypothetical protein